MPWFRRSDGDLVPDLPPMRRIMPYVMRGRNESAVYVPTDEERDALVEALAEVNDHPERLRSWDEVREELWADRRRSSSRLAELGGTDPTAVAAPRNRLGRD